jgi:hypothetical protein
MKTTIEIPDSLFRQAKARAAERGIPLRQFVRNGIEKELQSNNNPDEWRKAVLEIAGGLRHLKADNKRIRDAIEEEFEKIEPAMWA